MTQNNFDWKKALNEAETPDDIEKVFDAVFPEEMRHRRKVRAQCEQISGYFYKFRDSPNMIHQQRLIQLLSQVTEKDMQSADPDLFRESRELWGRQAEIASDIGAYAVNSFAADGETMMSRIMPGKVWEKHGDKIDSMERVGKKYLEIHNADPSDPRADVFKQKYIAIAKRVRAFESELGAKVRDRILGMSAISESEAQEWADSQYVKKEVVDKLYENRKYYLKDRYDPDKTSKEDVESIFRADMAEFYRMSNGKTTEINIVATDKKRASSHISTKEIRVDFDFTKSALWHEAGHLLEADPVFKKMTETFIDMKTDGRKSVKTLRELTGIDIYRNTEKAYEDHFHNPYVGKVYKTGFTEVASMGMEVFANPQLFIRMYQKDPLLFNMIIGMMMYREPYQDAKHNLAVKNAKVREAARESQK